MDAKRSGSNRRTCRFNAAGTPVSAGASVWIEAK
jgi:hypothetical protein